MNVSGSEINNLDSFIEQLTQCKPLKETEVKFLCEKVFQQKIKSFPKTKIKKKHKNNFFLIKKKLIKKKLKK